MAIFETALDFVLVNEGGLSEDVADPGGTTNFGISLRFLRGLSSEVLKRAGIFEPITDQTIRELTKEQATILYRALFWEPDSFDKIMNQQLANYIFDMAVNHGISQAIKITQRAICACQRNKDFVMDDGVLGAATIQGVNQASFMMIPALIAQRSGYYRELVALNPSLRGVLNGWLTRCYRI